MTGVACVGLVMSSCASGPNHRGGNSYGGGGSSRIDVGKTAAVVAVGVAGLSLYHYSRQKDARKKAERERDEAYAYGTHQGYQEPRYRDGRRGYRDRNW